MESAERTASIKDVAELAGVAVSSVSRVLANHPDVSSSMRDRVLAAVAATGYRPNSLARGLRSGRSMSIGFIVGDISNPLIAEIALAAERRFSNDDYTVVIANSQGTPSREIANIEMFQQRHVDGLLLSTSNENNAELREAALSFPKPIVLLDRDIEGLDLPVVRFDHARGFAQAVHHLASLGHRQLGLIAGTDGVRPTRERVRAVRDACQALGLPQPEVRLGSFDPAQGSGAVHDLFSNVAPPTALICGGNQILPGVIEAIRALGLRVPDDISLVTTDNSDLARFHEPPLAAIVRDAAALGESAAALLLAAIAGEATAPIELPTEFQEAASCAAPTGHDEFPPRTTRRTDRSETSQHHR